MFFCTTYLRSLRLRVPFTRWRLHKSMQSEVQCSLGGDFVWTGGFDVLFYYSSPHHGCRVHESCSLLAAAVGWCLCKARSTEDNLTTNTQHSSFHTISVLPMTYDLVVLIYFTLLQAKSTLISSHENIELICLWDMDYGYSLKEQAESSANKKTQNFV